MTQWVLACLLYKQTVILGAFHGQCGAHRAIGDSMTGLGIYDGDILVVKRSLRLASGQVVIAVPNGEPLKKLFMVQAVQSRCWRLALGHKRPMCSRGFSFS